MYPMTDPRVWANVSYTKRPLLALLLLAVWLATSGCGAPRDSATAATSPELPLIVTVPITVEVTRLVMTERVVIATPEPPVACAPNDLDDADEVVIGAILPLSQPASLSNALAVQTALTIAADEINAAGGIAGKPLRIWFADSNGDSQRAALLANEAIVEQCAAALIGASSSDSAAAALEVAHTHGRPYVILEATDDTLTATQYPEVFRLAPSNSMLTAMYGEWLAAVGDYNGDGKVSALLLVEDSESGTQQSRRIGAMFDAQGISWDAYPVELPSNDFSSLIARIVVKEEMPDAIYIRFNGDSSTVLHRQLLENGVGPLKKSLIVRMRAALDSDQFWQQMGENGVFTVVTRVGPWSGTVNERGAAFAGAFARYFDRWPEVQAFAAYDSLHLLADAITRAQSLAPETLIEALERSDITLASGHYSFPVTAQTAREEAPAAPWMWHQWLETPLVFLQYTAPLQSSSNMAVLWPPAYATVDRAVVLPNAP